MIETDQLKSLAKDFRIPGSLKVSSAQSHIAGTCYNLKSAQEHYIVQKYETIHTKKQIKTDLSLLRTLANHGFEVPLPIISSHGNSIDTCTLDKPAVIFKTRDYLRSKMLSEKDIYTSAIELAKTDDILIEKKSFNEHGKKINSIFTMFELSMREDHLVDDQFKSEYFAFKASFIDLLNHCKHPSIAFFPGNDIFFLTKENQFGFSTRSFLYEMPELFSLCQFILETCFDDNQLNYSKLDQATAGFSKSTHLPHLVWNSFDKVLKNAAFLNLICCWLTQIYHPRICNIDSLINARMKQKFLMKYVLEETK